ncbi:histidine phosphatase family protein [Paenibacillus sp. GCM10023252]|uniref:histidine phosphatase family protein n=1 Tax=Paenibacillus sp. GCM10023252 TaxID=3252649 RepID=UPI003614452E
MTEIVLIRHGSTAWNKEGRAQGHTNNPLDEEGLQQAEALAERLSGEQWDVIVSSDLQRAHQTAEAVRKRLGMDAIIVDERLREMFGGEVEGLTLAERVEKWGSNWKEQEIGMEKPDAGMIRGSACIDELAAQYPGQKILIVSHGAILRNTLRKLMPTFDTAVPLKNTSVTRLHRNEDGTWTCRLYNCVNHLEGE